MKYLFAFIFLTSSVYSQGEFIDTSKVWITEYGTWMGGQQEPRMYRFGDTIQENGKIYFKLYASVELNVDEFYFTGDIYREDRGKIFAKLGSRSSEELIMDQSISIGDTIGYDVLSRIDTILLKTGEKRKRLVFNEGEPWEAYWIENIGFATGGLSNIQGWHVGATLNCFYQNDSLIYSYQSPHSNWEYPCGQDLSDIEIYKGQLVSNINRWYIDEGVTGPTSFEGNRLYRFKGSINFNGQEYAQLNFSTTPWNLKPLDSYWREDVHGRVFALLDSIEYLVYDFDLQIGDSVPIVSDSAFVENIELIELLPLYWNIEDEKLRKRYEINRGNGELIYWVEGIGSEVAPFAVGNGLSSDSISDLLCFYTYNTRRYSPEGNSYCTVLDITENLGISAKSINDGIEISWNPINDDAGLLYLLERSSNAKNWHFVSEVISPQSMYIDLNPISGTSYYRLSSIDNYGKEKISNVESVVWNSWKKISLYPNPSTNIIGISGIDSGSYRIFNSVGKLHQEGLITNRPLDISLFKTGVYFLEIMGNNQNRTILKFIKS